MKRFEMSARDKWLVVGALGGPIAWTLLHVLGYYAVPGSHEYGAVTLLRVMALCAAVVPIACAAIGMREMKLATGDQMEENLQRRRFMAIAVVALSAISLLLIIGNAIAMLMLPPGAEP